MWAGPLLVGGSHVDLPMGWDASPLVLGLTFVLGMRVAGVPLRPTVVLSAVLAGLAVDLAIGAVGVSLVTTVSVSMLVVAALALRRAHQARRTAQGV